MTPVRLSKVLATADADGICKAQTLAAAGTLTLDGALVVAGVAQLGSQRRVAVVSAGDDTGKTATFYGTREGGTPVIEALALTNKGTIASDLDFLTVTKVAVDGKLASTAVVGTNTTGSTPWLMPNFHLTPFNVNIATQLSGSVTYNIETTQDDYWTASNATFYTSPEPNVTAIVTGGTVAQSATLSAAVTGFRYTITAGEGTLTAESTQAGIVNY